jgi:hypothetical protein
MIRAMGPRRQQRSIRQRRGAPGRSLAGGALADVQTRARTAPTARFLETPAGSGGGSATCLGERTGPSASSRRYMCSALRSQGQGRRTRPWRPRSRGRTVSRIEPFACVLKPVMPPKIHSYYAILCANGQGSITTEATIATGGRPSTVQVASAAQAAGERVCVGGGASLRKPSSLHAHRS